MEFVFVAPREALFPTCYPQGFERFSSDEEAQAFTERVRTHGFFVERARAELTPAWKQIIPYCLVSDGTRVLRMRRRKKSGESRLHDKLSIGVGGHINPIDHDDARDLVLAAARREIEEEVEVRGAYDLRLAGFLNDDSNPVGAVHLGLVYVALGSCSATIREQDVLEGQMVALDELRAGLARRENFETWSSLLIAHLDELLLVRQHATT